MQDIVTKSEILWLLKVVASHFWYSSSKVITPDRKELLKSEDSKFVIDEAFNDLK